MLIQLKKTALIALISILISGPSWAQTRINPALPRIKIRKSDKVLPLKKSLSLKRKKLSTDLLQLIDSTYLPEGTNREKHVEKMKKLRQLRPKLTAAKLEDRISEGMVHVYLYLKSKDKINIVKQFVSQPTGQDEKRGIVAAWVKTRNLDKIASIEGVRTIRSVMPPITRAGSVVTEGDAIHRTADVRSIYSQGGSGIKVGIISDGVDHLSDAQATNDLPAGVTVLSNAIGGDEGTAMLEIVHDMVPDAELYFHDCGINTIAFNSAINDLVTAGCNVICDDIGWITQPFFEDGNIASHLKSVLLSNDIIYVSSAGNAGYRHHQTIFYPQADPNGDYHDFSEGSDPTSVDMYCTIPRGGRIRVVLQWNDTFGSSNNDYNLHLYSFKSGSVVLSNTDIQDGDDDPMEFLVYTASPSTEGDFAIWVSKEAGAAAKTLELFMYPDGGANSYSNNTSPLDAIFGHPAVPGALAIGAIAANDPGNDTIEAFSSQGPVTISYPFSESRLKPDLCGIDGVSITGTGGFPNPFYGTSAAAPHAAAIAAQVWAQHPSKTGNQICSWLNTSAVDLGVTGFDYVYGYGRTDALNAFSINTYLLTVTSDDNGTVTGSGVVNHGITTEITATPDEGYVFFNWTVTSGTATIEDVNNPVTNVTLTAGNATVQANFAIDQYTVTFVEGENGSITGTLVQTIDHGGNCTEVTAVPDANCSFTGWTGDYTGATNPLTVTNVTADMTITANFNLKIIKGPYLQMATSTTITIMWETDDPEDSRVDFGTTTPDSVDSVDATLVEIHEIRLENLTPDKKYYYTVTSNGAQSAVYTFSTAPATERDFRFAAYGDIQRETPVHGTVVQGILGYDPEFIFHTGDMVNGGRYYSQWAPQFFNQAQELICSTSFMPALGNHEYYGSGQLWFKEFFSLPNNEEWYAYTYSNTRFVCLNTEVDYREGSAQYNWLVSELQSTDFNNAAWHIAYFHRPPFTAANRHSDEDSVKKYLVPLFEQYDVNMVFSGHSHLYERYFNNSIYYFVIGGGGMLLDRLVSDTEPPIRDVGAEEYHYCIFDVDISAQSLALSVRDINDEEIDNVTLYKVTFVAGENGSINGDLIQEIKEDSSCTEVDAVGDANYHFTDWTGDYTGTENPLTVTDVTSSMTVTANFAIDQHTVTFNAGSNGNVNGQPQVVQVVDHGSGCTEVTASPSTGYHFKEWTGDYTGTNNPLTIENVIADMTVTANFEIDTFVITATAYSGGSIVPEGEVVLDYGDDQTFTITPEPGYQVDSVKVDGSNEGAVTEYTFTNVTADHTIEAFFSLISTITVTSPNGGEELIVTSIHTITWTSQGIEGNVKIEYSSNSGSDWTTIAADTDNDGSHFWTVPEDTSSNCILKISEASDGDPVDMSDAVFTIQYLEQNIPLSSGWHMISFNVDLLNYSVEDVFSGIGSLVLVKNNAGQVYMPEFLIDEIGLITITEGYKVYTEDNETLLAQGVPFPDISTIPIPLLQGWNMISYLPGSAMPIETALQDIVDDIVIVKNNAGMIYMPHYGINNIGTMNPGEGYKINMETASSFTYPLMRSQSTVVHTSAALLKRTVHFSFTGNTGNNMTVVVQAALNPLINGVAIETDDEIGVFTPAGLCVGGAVWTGSNVAVTVWGDDDQTAAIDGIKGGETLQYRLWDASADKEYNAGVTYTSGNPYYSVDGISVLASLQSVEPASVSVIYPNGGEVLIEGESTAITWNSTGTVGNVLIEYTYDNGVNWTVIADDVGNTGSYSWTVPSTLSATCKVRISETPDGVPVDESDNAFTIDKATPVVNGNSVSAAPERFAVVPNPVDLAENENTVSFFLFTERTVVEATVSIFDAVGNVVATIEPYSMQTGKQGKRYDLGTWNLYNKYGRKVAGGTYLVLLAVTGDSGKKERYTAYLGVKEY